MDDSYYIPKEVLLKVEKYESGTEDGIVSVTVTSSIKRVVADWYGEVLADESNKCKVQLPYLDTEHGKAYISPNDYIITTESGRRYPCTEDIFSNIFTSVIPTKSDK